MSKRDTKFLKKVEDIQMQSSNPNFDNEKQQTEMLLSHLQNDSQTQPKLAEQLLDLKGQLGSLEAQTRDYQQQIYDLKQEVQRYKAATQKPPEIKAQVLTAAELQLKEQLKLQEKKYDGMKSERDKLQIELEERQKEILKLNQFRAQSLSDQKVINQMAKEKTLLMIQISQLQAHIDDTKLQIDFQFSKHDELQQKQILNIQQQQESKLEQITMDKGRLAAEIEALDKKLVQQQQQFSSQQIFEQQQFQKQIEKLRAENQNLLKEKLETQIDLKRFQQDSQHFGELVAVQKQKMTNQSQQISVLELQLKEAMAQIKPEEQTEQNVQVTKIQSEKELRQKFNQMQREFNQLQTQLLMQTQEYQEKLGLFDQIRQQRNHFEKLVLEEREKTQKAQQELAEIKENDEQRLLKHYECLIHSLKIDCKNYQKLMQESDKKLQEQLKYQKEKDKFDELVKENGELRQQVQKFKFQCKTAENRLKEAQIVQKMNGVMGGMSGEKQRMWRQIASGDK